MIDTALSLITGTLWPYIAAALAALAGMVAVYAKGRADANAKADARRAEDDLQAHERMNHAETGADLDDGGRRDWLRGFADRNRR